MSKEDFETEVMKVQQIRARIAAAEVLANRRFQDIFRVLDSIDSPDWPSAYMVLLEKAFRDDLDHSSHPEDWKDNNVHNDWKIAVQGYYDIYNPLDPKNIWCALMRRYLMNT